MRFFIVIFIISIHYIYSQDYSKIGNKIEFSDTLLKAKKYTNIENALENPEEVYYLKLDCDKKGENFRNFSINCVKFKNLRKLELNCYFTKGIPLPDSIWSLKKLEYLTLSGFSTFSANGIQDLKNLKYLSFSFLNLKSVPSEIFELNKLEYLDLSANELNQIPNQIKKLTNLKEIELTSNCFTAIPKELSELKNLVHITTNNAEHGGISPDGKILCDNELNDFPEFLKDMPNLKSVSCFYGVNVNSELKKKIKSSFPKIKFS